MAPVTHFWTGWDYIFVGKGASMLVYNCLNIVLRRNPLTLIYICARTASISGKHFFSLSPLIKTQLLWDGTYGTLLPSASIGVIAVGRAHLSTPETTDPIAAAARVSLGTAPGGRPTTTTTRKRKPLERKMEVDRIDDDTSERILNTHIRSCISLHNTWGDAVQVYTYEVSISIVIIFNGSTLKEPVDCVVCPLSIFPKDH